MYIIKKYIVEHFFIKEEIVYDKNNEELINLFTDENLNASYIDSYSENSMSLLTNKNCPKSLKENILSDQRILKEKLESYGIEWTQYKESQVDNFIRYRTDQIGYYYYEILAQNSAYKRELSASIKSSSIQALYCISLNDSPIRGKIKIDEKEISYIFFPIARYLNSGIKGMDVALIHELIHTFCKYPEKNTAIINEVLTEKLAITITKRLHNKNIFIFDDPNDYVIEGECVYERLFPFIEGIYTNFSSLLKEGLLNDDYSKLEELLQSTWPHTIELLNLAYEKIIKIKLSVHRGDIEKGGRHV